MKKIYKIALNELQSIFYSPIAWLILIIFAFQAAMAFTGVFEFTVKSHESNYRFGNLTFTLLGGPRGLFSNIQGYLYLYIPLITMGLMSRELSSGSIKLLYSSPVKNAQIILGKFLSMMVYGLIMIAVLSIFVLWFSFVVKDFDFPTALSGLLGLYLLICTYAAIGLFMSSLTSYQVVAAIGTLSVLSLLNFIARVWQEYDFVREITYWLSIGGRANEFTSGLICSEDILYFFIVSGLFLALSIARMKAIRQKSRWQVSFSKYAFIFAVAMMLGFLSSRPKLMSFYDATATKQRTITKNSQEIIKRVDGKLTLTTYVNVLDRLFQLGLPRNRMNDQERFRQFRRFKPEIKMKYVYYYTDAKQPLVNQNYPASSDAARVGRISKIHELDSNMFMPPEEIRKIIDLEPEEFRMTRVLERENGDKTFLRMFNDMTVYPGETEISAALKRLIMDRLPVVGFLAGHGERDFNNISDRGYYGFSQNKPFRQSLINQGFDCEEVYLDSLIPAHVNILMIADMLTPLTPEEQTRLDEYIARGGHLFILGEPRRQDILNPVIAQFGVQLLPGRIVKYTETKTAERNTRTTGFNRTYDVNNEQADLIVSYLEKEGSELSYILESMYRQRHVISTPGCAGLTYTTDKGYRVIPLCRSDTIDSWNKLEAANFYEDTIRFNPAIGEVKRSHPTGLALTRQVGDREQKIIIMGDADCLSNKEISSPRGFNYNLITGSFFWMSEGEVPIDVRRPTPPDGAIYAVGKDVRLAKTLTMGVLPSLLLIGCLVIWLRRRGR